MSDQQLKQLLKSHYSNDELAEMLIELMSYNIPDKMGADLSLLIKMQNCSSNSKDYNKYATYVVRQEDCTSEILEMIATNPHSGIIVKKSIAEHPNVSCDTLNKLSKDKNKEVRISVARKTSDPKTLDNLYKDRSLIVKKEVVKNNNSPLEMLKNIAKDSNSERIMLSMVYNENIDNELILILLRKKFESIAKRILLKSKRKTGSERRKLTNEVYDFIMNNYDSLSIKETLLQRKDLPEKYMLILANDKSAYIRRTIRKHPHATKKVIENSKMTDALYNYI